MTPQEAVTIWAILGSANPGAELDERTIEIRAELILDLDYGAARQAAIGLAQSARWVPGVAEFREAVIVPSLPTPDEVWEEILQLVASHGWPSPPGEAECSPVAWKTIRALGGWMRVCEGDERVDRAHVLKQIAPQVIERTRRDLVAGPIGRIELPEADERRELADGED